LGKHIAGVVLLHLDSSHRLLPLVVIRDSNYWQVVSSHVPDLPHTKVPTQHEHPRLGHSPRHVRRHKRRPNVGLFSRPPAAALAKLGIVILTGEGLVHIVSLWKGHNADVIEDAMLALLGREGWKGHLVLVHDWWWNFSYGGAMEMIEERGKNV